MTYLLRLIALLTFFFSMQSTASYYDLKVDASGILTRVDSRFPSLNVGDSWSSSTTFKDVYYWDSLKFNYSNSFGNLQLGNISTNSISGEGHNGPISVSTCIPCLNELMLLWNYGNYFFIDGNQLGNVRLRMESGLAPASLSTAQLTDLESVVNNFEFYPPNSSIFQMNSTIEGSVDTFSLTIVPLPAGIYLFLSGLVGLVGFKLRGRNA